MNNSLDVAPAEDADYDRVDPRHGGPNTVRLTRIHVAGRIRDDGCRRVLDLPTGSGMLVKLLLQAGIEAVGADLEPESFRVPGQACVFADLNARLPFPDESFDGFACIEGIEHIENPHLLAREAARILRPRGRLYISTPNVLSIRSRLSYLFRGYPDQFHYMIEVDEVTGRERPIAHINPVGMLELRYVLARAGLDVVRIEANRLRHTGSPWYRFLRWWMQSRGRRAARAHERVAAVRRHLLSDAVLFGEGLIVTAVKAAAPPSVGP